MLLGANGAVGRTLGPLLSARNTPYKVVGRSLLALQVRFHEDSYCGHYQWDPQDSASIAEACEGAGTIVYLVGAALWKFKDHLPLTESCLAAAKAVGARRFLLVSSNWSYSPPFAERVTEEHSREPKTAKGRIRKEQEDRVLAAHETGGLSTGVLRMADLYGPKVEASYLWSVFQAAKKGTEAQVLGPVDQPHEFVYVPDAAETIARLLETDDAWSHAAGQCWNLAGPSVTTVQAMTEAIFKIEGKPAKYNVPGSLMMRLVRAMNPYIRELEELRYLLAVSLLLDDRKLASLLGGLPKTAYADGIKQTLALR